MPQPQTIAGAEIAAGFAGQSRIRLTHPDGGSADLDAHGGQLLSWHHPAGDILFLSTRTDAHQERHGGIPVIFPQFGKGFGPTAGSLPQHGFARDQDWRIDHSGTDDAGRATATLSLQSTPALRSLWPHDFVLRLTVALGDDLTVTMEVTNCGGAPMPFSAGLHTYFRVSDVRTAQVEGLQGLRFRDNLKNWAEFTETAPELVPDGETDRVYLGSPLRLRLHDDARCIRIENHGFANVVVWNPGPGSDSKYDFAPGEWSRFVCIEPATVFNPVVLAAGASWRGEQRIAPESGSTLR